MKIRLSLRLLTLLALAAFQPRPVSAAPPSAVPVSPRSKTSDAPRAPVILVPGWGYDKSEAIFGRDVFGSYRLWLLQAGYRAEDIHIVDYSYGDTVQNISRDMGRQLREIVRHHPAGTRFDMMAHSLGGFVGLYAMMDAGLGAKLRKFVSLAGIPFGWNNALCSEGRCGLAHLSLTPFHSSFVMDFHRRFRRELAAVETCSLFSPADEFVRPYDAGRFPQGTNVEIPGAHHMDFIWKRSCFDEMRRRCYPHY